MATGYVEFELDLPSALLAELVRVLDCLGPAVLSESNLSSIPDAQGVYQLFLNGDLVYIGKTDADAGLHSRLSRHADKIQHRVGLDPALVSFKAVRVFVFTAMDLEAQLIKEYSRADKPQWNGSGFGSNDPGRQRDTTTYKEDHFDRRYPIDIDRVVYFNAPTEATAAEHLNALKGVLPYVLRTQSASPKSKQAHPDLVGTHTRIPGTVPKTARGLLACITQQLPAGWQATKLLSHLILYSEKRDYPQGEILGRS